MNVNDLLNKIKILLKDLQHIVDNNDKKRFSFNDDETKIRANQGHSIEVDVELSISIPPKFLYHGICAKMYMVSFHFQETLFFDFFYIFRCCYDTALNVAKRYCKNDTPHIFKIDTYPMIVDNIKFYLSENGVWLVNTINPKYKCTSFCIKCTS